MPDIQHARFIFTMSMAEPMNVQHKAAILIYVRFSLAQRPYAILMLYYAFRV